MTADADVLAAPPPGAHRLAVLLSAAARIEPQLLRAVRLGLLPELDVGAESDLWFSDWVASRSAEMILLEPAALPRLRAMLSRWLAESGDDAGKRLRAEIERVHAGLSPVLRLEEETVWLAVSGGTEEAINEALTPALHALVAEDRGGVADWFVSAWERLPGEVQRSRVAWQLLQIALQRRPGIRVTAAAGSAKLSAADLAPILGAVADVPMGVRRDGPDLWLGDLPDATALIMVPDTHPRVVEVTETSDRPTLHTAVVQAGEVTQLRVGWATLALRTARGDVYRLEAPRIRQFAGRVFLSYTSELGEYPKGQSFVAAAEEAVISAGGTVLKMEYFSATDETPGDRLQVQIRYADVYVGIIGFRYGSPVQNAPDRSYTELEFETADRLGLPRLMFLLGDNAPLPQSALSDPAYGDRQRAFRERIMSTVVAAKVSSPDQLKTELVRSLLSLSSRTGDVRAVAALVRIAPRPAFLAGRETLLAALDARLGARQGTTPTVVALFGLGGVGKTSVALEYAHRHLNELGVAWQFAAEEPTSLVAGFGDLAAQLGAGERPGDPVATVHAALARRQDWLLIFDNAPDPAAIEGMIPPTGGGQVIITSQYGRWPGGHTLEVPVLEQAAAAAFLLARTGSTEEAAASELATELGGLPLALEQAGAYIQASSDSIAGYLALFRRRSAELLARGEPAGYDKSVSTTWALAFAELGESSPATGLLRLMAFYAADDIPLNLLLRSRSGLHDALDATVASQLLPLLDDDRARDDAVAALRLYSLISAPHDGLVSMHRLGQAVVMAQMPADVATAWRRAAAAIIEAALPDDPENPSAWTVFAALLPHAQAALDPTGAAMEKVASYLGESGNYAAALALERQILQARERVLGDEHSDTLRSRANLALWTGQAGDPTAARDQYADLLPKIERLVGPEHPRTLTTRANLARLTGEAGDAAAARDLYADLLPLRERVSGPEASRTLSARASLAFWTGKAGDPAAARDQYAGLLTLYERILGPEHPRTLTIRANLAHWTGQTGDPAAARDQYADVLRLRERVLGPEHPSTLNARSGLAFWTGQAGDPVAARDQYAGLLPLYERVLGPEHPRTLAARASLENWAQQAGQI
jgi:hypothetical protein